MIINYLDSNNDNIENIEKIDKNNTFERGDETIKKDVQDILEKLDENMKQIENKDEPNDQEEHMENFELKNKDNILVDENAEMKANENQAEENNNYAIDNEVNKGAILNEARDKSIAEGAERQGNDVNLDNPNMSSNHAEERFVSKINVEAENFGENNINGKF